MKVITRFAPSPTGYLHIGSARTAIFNYLFAKHYDGKFLLRIEDTDKARSTQEATNAIINGLEWLGVKHDGEIMYQSQRADRHREVALELVKQGRAYKCFSSQEKIEKERQKSIDKGESFLFKSPWRDASESDHPENMPFVVRLKASREGKVIINDIIQGEVVVSSEILDDMVLLRGDGSPTYMLAVVVDDKDMDVTHIIRGDDHLNNAFRQKILYEAMGWQVPIMGHIPLIHGEDGAKLSKRHGAVGIEWYRDEGYLPDALFNYLVRLGWSHGDEEIIPINKAIEWFDGSHIGKSASRMNFEKLKYINSQYLRNMANPDLISYIKAYWKEKNITMSNKSEKFLLQALEDLKVRSVLISDLADLALIYHEENIYNITEEAKKTLSQASEDLIISTRELIKNLEIIEKDTIQAEFKKLATEKNLKLGELMNPVRALITGLTSSPSVFHIIEILGKEIILSRFDLYKREM